MDEKTKVPAIREGDVLAERVGFPTPMEYDQDKVTRAVAFVDSVTQAIDRTVKVSLGRTNHQDWVKMGGKDGKVKFYLQASGHQKLRAIWGIYYRDRIVVKEPLEDGHVAYLATGLIGSKLLDGLYGEVTLEIEGGRSSKDPFFCGNDGKKSWDLMDVRKAALANWEVRAVTALLGLGNLNEEDLRKNGVQVEKIGSFEFKQGAEGGGNTALISAAQGSRLYAISKSSKVSEEDMKKLIEAYGFQSSRDITRERYENICAIVEGGPGRVKEKVDELLDAKRTPPANGKEGAQTQ